MASSPAGVIDLSCQEGEQAATHTASDADAVHMGTTASGFNAGEIPRRQPPEGASGDEKSVVSGGAKLPLHDSTNTALAETVGRGAGDATAAPVRKKRKAPPPKEDGGRCSICLDEWTSKGKHRVCTLLCGHLFGNSCIERWLKERRSCPQCGAKVGSKGSKRVIPLFVQNLVAKDTGELETARTFLEEEKRLRKQCEAERVRLSIENATLRDLLSRQSSSRMGKNSRSNPGGGGGGGGGDGYGFKPPLPTSSSTPSALTFISRACPGVASPPPSVLAGHPAFAQSTTQGRNQRTGAPMSLSSMGGDMISPPSPSPLPSRAAEPRQDSTQGLGLPTSWPGGLSNSSSITRHQAFASASSGSTQASFSASWPSTGGLASSISPGPVTSSAQQGLIPLASSSGAGPAGVCDHSSGSNSSSAPLRQTMSLSPRQAERHAQNLLVSPSPGSGIVDSKRVRSTCPTASPNETSGVDVGSLLRQELPSGLRSSEGPSTSPAAAAYSQHNRSLGDFHGSAGGACGSTGGNTAAWTAAGPMRWGLGSREAGVNVEIAVRSEHLLSRNAQAGRAVAFAGGATGALLVSQEFGAWRPQHGITKFSLADLRHHKNIHLHRDQIRDMKFSAEGGNVSYVLSTGFDKTLKVCDLRTDSVVVSYNLEGNGWSCQWSATNPTQMFCGVVDGTRVSAVQLFDLRSTAGAVRKLRAAAGQRQPIHSICHTADDLLLCATMGGVWGWGHGTKSGSGSGSGEEQAERLQIQAGPCCSLSQKTHAAEGASSSSSEGGGVEWQERFLVSTRGSSASHAVFGLQAPLALSAAASDASGVSELVAEGGLVGGHTERERNWDVDANVRQAGQGASGAGTGAAAADSRAWSKRWMRFPGAMQGHQSQQTLSRSLLWEPSPGAGLLIAGGDERTNQPWIWNASSGDVCHRLSSHRSPVLDVASFQENSSGKGLFAAVSQGELNVYQTHVFET